MEPSTLYFLLKAFFASAELAGCSLAFFLNLDVEDTKERSRIVIIGGGIVIPSILILVFGVWWGLLVTPIYAYLGAVLYGVWLKDHFDGVDWLCSEVNKSLFEKPEPLRIIRRRPIESPIIPDDRIYEGEIYKEHDANFYEVSLRLLAPAYQKAVWTSEAFMQAFTARLEAALAEAKIERPPDDLYSTVKSVALFVYETSQPPFPDKNPPSFSDFRARMERCRAQMEKFDALLIVEACVQSMLAFLKPIRWDQDGFLRVPLHKAVPLGATVRDMVMPFYKTGNIEARGLCEAVRERYRKGTGIAKDKLHTKQQVWPQDYTGSDLLSIYLLPQFQELFDFEVLYQPFTDDHRCGHHWCIGRTRMGKSTYLRHIIWDDLHRAAMEECSVVIIDSKSMVDHMRKLAVFGPGQPLDGKLILIDSDVRFPLNPFYIGAEAKTPSQKDAGKQLAKTLITYMLANLNPAPGQERALPFLAEATLHSRNKSLEQLLRYVQMDREVLPSEIGSFPSDVQDWFRTTRKGLNPATLGGLDERLTSFINQKRHTPLYKNLNAGRWGDQEGKFDLYEELHQGGKVLLIDTDNQKNDDEGTNLLGRLFIAMLSDVMMRRMKLTEKKPIYVYIDEAADYLTFDKSFIKIFAKAGEARLGMTVAYQYKGQDGVDAEMEKALNNASIHSECIEPGTVDVVLNKRTKLTLPIKKFEFKEQDRMDEEDYKRLRAELAAKYPYKAPPPAPDIDDEPLTQKNP